jgi:cold shock CspA family protein
MEEKVADLRLEGRVDVWFAEKGYGFVASGRERHFLHLSEFMLPSSLVVPVRGDYVRFELGTNPRNGRECAVRASLIPRAQ